MNVTVTAPFTVPESTVVPVELRAFTPDRALFARKDLQAVVHDYGVEVTVRPTSIDALPGLPSEVFLRVKNLGNDNDTLNLSAHLVDLPTWTVDVDAETVRLQPQEFTEVRAIIRPPTAPLPSTRDYTFQFFAGTVGGAAVDLPKNDTATVLLRVPGYRALDVDRDGSLELAVDENRQSSDGYEVFHEVFSDGVQSNVVAKGPLDGKMRFFLDAPQDASYDGIANIWFDPESVYAFEITVFADINEDGTPEYFIDADRDREGKLDRAFDTVGLNYWRVYEAEVYGDDRKQYLVDMTGDGQPDRFYDPEQDLVTRTLSATRVGPTMVGIDTDDDGNADRYYDTETERVSQAQVRNFGDFFLEFWYFFVAFAAFAVVTVGLLVRRSRS